MTLTTERHATHGDFKLNAQISQELKQVIAKWDTKGLSAPHREALEMICLKMSRILSGRADFKDHWDDIGGYARLGADHIDTKSRLSLLNQDSASG